MGCRMSRVVAPTSCVAHTAALGWVTAANSESTGPGPGMRPLAASGAQTREEVPGGGPGRAACWPLHLCDPVYRSE